MAYMLAILDEEYERLASKQKFYETALAKLPHGSIQVKIINNKKYNYLCYREGKKVVTQYISPENIEHLQEQLCQYRQAKAALKNIHKNLKILKKVLKNNE